MSLTQVTAPALDESQSARTTRAATRRTARGSNDRATALANAEPELEAELFAAQQYVGVLAAAKGECETLLQASNYAISTAENITELRTARQQAARWNFLLSTLTASHGEATAEVTRIENEIVDDD